MERTVAENMATEAIFYLNPLYWNGKGEKPKRFYNSLSYKMSFWKCDLYVTPTFDKNDNEWRYTIELKDLETSKTLCERTCYAVNDIGYLASTILELDEWYNGHNAEDDNKQVCILSVDVQLQRDGKYDVCIGEDGGSGWHKANMTLEEIGEQVMHEIQCYAEALDK